MDESSSMVDAIELTLPWPPSVNHYWRRFKNRYFVSAEGKKYRDQVYYECKKIIAHFSSEDRIAVNIDAYPPDKRRRDLDNILKSLLDSLQYAGIYQDDNQIDRLCIVRKERSMIGQVVVTLSCC